MPDTVKIITFNNEFEARLLKELLDESKIPNFIRSYHDSAYDGLWQTGSCWGHLEAPEEFRDDIMRIFSEMSKPENISENI